MRNDREQRAFRDRLASLETPSRVHRERFREEIRIMMENEKKRMKRKKRVTNALWIYLVLLCTAFLVIGGQATDPTRKLWFGILAAFWLTAGGIMLLRYWIDRNRLLLMEQIMELKVQLQELKEDRTEQA